MVSTIWKSPIFTPPRRCAQWGAIDMLSWPPATMIEASPLAICCMPRATARRPEPQSWLSPKAVASIGTPALIAAWRAGFWPWPATSTCPRITSSTSAASTPALSRTARITAAPRSWAATLAKAPLKEPTAVRVAETMTMSDMVLSRSGGVPRPPVSWFRPQPAVHRPCGTDA
ncbi:hypothetical protein A6302_00113 [Methylobrevis pamukkalensis]|uniref:Uncharacterized protein n=1 Tax=Methylobrevis pamukkalensis TaxID=1439726 RepID=A0A1E3H8H2_9HYPH|nr:hypothetical protein A6302_00113 [Methylobrevis pamukkalensis]